MDDHEKYSDSESDDESSQDAESETENPEFDMDFFRVLAALRTNHPILEKEKFFKNSPRPSTSASDVKEEKPFTVTDNERKMVLERGGMYEDEDEEEFISSGNSESHLSKEGEKFKFEDNLSDDDGDGEDIFTKAETTLKDVENSEKSNKNSAVEFLKGTKKSLNNKEDEELLKTLKQDWEKNMSEKDKFLMDYFVNKRYLEDEDDTVDRPSNHYILDIEPLEKDEETFEKMEQYETKYRFRFEEPDNEFIQRHPRLIKDSVRQKNDKRKKIRERRKEKKEQEEERRVQEIRRMKALKKKEIMDQIEKLKNNVQKEKHFKDIDLEGDFDPEKHDRLMSELYDDSFYNEEEGNEDPNCDDDQQQLFFKELLEEESEKLKQVDDSLQESDFKYREVTPNSYGLTTTEILCAKSSELNKWCPIKSILCYKKSERDEVQEKEHFERKAANDSLKSKFLPSLYEKNAEEMLAAEEERKRKKNLKKKERKLRKLKVLEKAENKKSKRMQSGEEQRSVPAVKPQLQNNVDKSSSTSGLDHEDPQARKKKKKNGERKTGKREKGEGEVNRVDEMVPCQLPGATTADSREATARAVEEVKSVPSRKRKRNQKDSTSYKKPKHSNFRAAAASSEGIGDERLRAYGQKPSKAKYLMKSKKFKL